ncbi:MAG: lytic transglycosylase domain-containing protein [Cyanobacteria bacterium SIG30]|nr:lytic transglycosylase domain-containing protein [Cyanobacteria bacterium SIG30]
MFSPTIQNYINTSGEANMRKRIAQLEGYVKSIENKNIELPKQTQEVKAQPFKNVLQATLEDGKVFDIDKPPIHNVKFGSITDIDKTGSSSNSPTYTKAQIMDLIEKTAQKYGVDEKLVKAVVKQESGFNPKAESKAGAQGLMQLMPATAKSLGVKDSLNPVQNVDGGVRYLKSMLQKYNGNKILALAAYNAGPGAVSKYNGVPPYKETQNYVMSILKDYL